MFCKICNSKSTQLFSQKTHVLNKYPIHYYQCSECQFIQTEEPFWLSEAYESAITSLDLGLVNRNFTFSKIVASLIASFFDRKKEYLDYGGGYGMLVRIMRDRGFHFYRYDTYCENIFAKNFDDTDTQSSTYELLTAFEVFEHLMDPVSELEKMLSLSDSIFFSTELQPTSSIHSSEDWWYFTPETGQHIALYSAKSLELLAHKFGCNFYTNNRNLHLITRKKINPLLFKLVTKYRVSALHSVFIKQKSLLMEDFNFIKSKRNHSVLTEYSKTMDV